MGFASALVIFAHPDDAEFLAGGTIARWAREGTDVHYCCITDGSAGSNEPGVTREQIKPVRLREQRAAADVLGVKQVHFLDYVDGMIEVTFGLRRDVTRVVRSVRPEVILAPDPQRLWFGSGYVNHWDHKVAGTVALCAVMPDSPTRAQFPELLDEGLEPYEIPNLWLSSNEPDTYVDITDTIEVKVAALAEHASEEGGEAAPWVRERAATVGAEAGYAYAEAFRAFRFVEDEPEGLEPE